LDELKTGAIGSCFFARITLQRRVAPDSVSTSTSDLNENDIQ
jgi:hypothetical protein